MIDNPGSMTEGSFAREPNPDTPKPRVEASAPVSSRGLWFEAVRVAGITNYVTNVDDVVGEEVILEREPNNPFHKQAIVVHVVEQLNGVETKRKIGYVPRDLASMILDHQLPARGRIEWRSTSPIIAIKIRA